MTGTQGAVASLIATARSWARWASGFLPTTAIMVLICSLAFGAKPRLAVPLAIIAPFTINLIFLKLLRVPLPGGILPFSW